MAEVMEFAEEDDGEGLHCMVDLISFKEYERTWKPETVLAGCP